MNLKRLLSISALLMFATFVWLLIDPAGIPVSLGMSLTPNQYFIAYQIAASELAIAFLSLVVRNTHELQTRRMVSLFFVIFHAATGLLALYAFFQGGPPKLLGNVGFRALATGLFYYYGLVRREVPKKIYSR